jgi:hypothetical protein
MFQSHREWTPVICFMHVFRHYIHVLTRGKNKHLYLYLYLYCIVHDGKYNVDGVYSMNTTNLFPRWFVLFRLEEEVTKTPKNCRI